MLVLKQLSKNDITKLLLEYYLFWYPAGYLICPICLSVEARSTVSDTWSTDVLPSDTEYPDGGSEYLGPEPSGNDSSSNLQSASGRYRVSSVERSYSGHHHHHRRRYDHHQHQQHRHHCDDPLCLTHEIHRDDPGPDNSVHLGSVSATGHHRIFDDTNVLNGGTSLAVSDGPTFFTPIHNGDTTSSVTQAPNTLVSQYIDMFLCCIDSCCRLIY